MSLSSSRHSALGWGAAVLALTVGLAGCGSSADPTAASDPILETAEQANGDDLAVVASFSVLCSMVEQVAADVLEPTCLIGFDQDPHTYEATPFDRRAIELADVVFYAGLDFEPSIIQMVEATNTSAPQIAVHEEAVTTLLELEEDGDIEPDPHIWHDVDNGIRMVQLIEQTLAEVDPTNAEQYASNAAALIQDLEQLQAWIPTQIATIPEDQRRLVTTHDAFQYFAQAYSLTVEGTLLGISTEEEPTAAQVKSLTEGIKSAQVPKVFAELTSNDKVLRTVAREAGVSISEQVLIADGIGQLGTPEGSYQGMLVYNTCIIAEGLGGTCTPLEF